MTDRTIDREIQKDIEMLIDEIEKLKTHAIELRNRLAYSNDVYASRVAEKLKMHAEELPNDK
jgi:cell division septum initiation protein DivIVA